MKAVTGASGFFGRALEKALAPEGGLRGLFRAPSEASKHWQTSGHEVVFGDLEDREALDALVAGADTVFHLAARMGKDDAEASHRVNVLGTEQLARAARAADVRRLVYVSSISVYAATPHDGEIIEDVAPQHVDRLNPYSATKYQGELVLRELSKKGEAPDFTIIRPTNVYGPWSGPWFVDWARRLQRIPVAIGGDIEIDVVHVDDVVGALREAANSPAARGEVLHIGHENVLLGEFAVSIGQAIGRKVRTLPGSIDYLVRALLEVAYPIVKGGRRSMSLLHPVRYPHDKARRLIGYEPQIRLADSVEGLGRWYREEYLPSRG
jgi:nucleoside-diphosphate-sugar epimerase